MPMFVRGAPPFRVPCQTAHVSARMKHMRICALLLAAVACAQQRAPIGIPHVNLAEGPWIFDTAEQHKIRVSVVARGLSHPWSVVFLPGGDMLVTERAGRLRVVRDGKLDA